MFLQDPSRLSSMFALLKHLDQAGQSDRHHGGTRRRLRLSFFPFKDEPACRQLMLLENRHGFSLALSRPEVSGL
jgi:hypothetical protein